MPDPGNPDQDPKPFKPDPKRRLFDPPSGEPRRDFAEPDPNYDPDKADQTHATDQETLFRAAAIKCAQMEEEIDEIVSDQNLPDGFRIPNKEIEDLIENNEGWLEVERNPEVGLRIVLTGSENQQDVTRYTDSYILLLKNPKMEDLNLEYDATYVLTLGGYIGDRETFNAYHQYLHSPSKEYASNRDTFFFFSRSGDYKKIIRLDKRFPHGSSLKFISSDSGLANYNAPMTVEDFEVVQQALQTLIDKLKPQEKPAE